jgi:hypothetical protein
MDWREDFDGETIPQGWLTGSWGSPKNLSTHDPLNVNIVDGYVVLSLTSDSAVGPTGAMPEGTGGGAGSSGTAGSAGSTGSDDGEDDGGCSVSAAGSSRANVLLGVLGAAAWLVLGRRRARR